MAPPLILVVEDDPRIALSIQKGLENAGFRVETANNGDLGMERALTRAHDLIILDLTLPGQSGHDILRGIQGILTVPVIVITARQGLDPRLRSFELGADDVLPKPFWVDELLARVRRRLTPAVRSRTVAWGEARVDLDAHVLFVADEPVALTTSEYNVLAYLVERPNRAVSRSQLLEGALPMDTEALERTVDSHVARLRAKLGGAADAVQTVWRVGYRFCP